MTGFECPVRSVGQPRDFQMLSQAKKDFRSLVIIMQTLSVAQVESANTTNIEQSMHIAYKSIEYNRFRRISPFVDDKPVLTNAFLILAKQFRPMLIILTKTNFFLTQGYSNGNVYHVHFASVGSSSVLILPLF